jgi:hypothetical protein
LPWDTGRYHHQGVGLDLKLDWLLLMMQLAEHLNKQWHMLSVSSTIEMQTHTLLLSANSLSREVKIAKKTLIAAFIKDGGYRLSIPEC